MTVQSFTTQSFEHAYVDQGFLKSCELKFPHAFNTLHFTFETFEQAKQLAAHLTSYYPKQNQTTVELGLNEIFLNAIEHGNLGFSLTEKIQLKKSNLWDNELQRRLLVKTSHEMRVDVTLEITPTQISVTVKDQGAGFDWRQMMATNMNISPYLKSGRGLFMAKELSFHDIQFSEVGNEVKCIFVTA